MPTNEKILGVIPARWASSRFPGKPLADINGKPMVQWVSEQVQKASLITEVIVATDDKRIYDVVFEFGGKAVMTSSKHQSGTDRVAEVAKNIECDIVVNVQGDEPLIPSENIDLVIKPLLNSEDLPVTTLMTDIRSRSEMLDPNICKVVVDNNGRALYFTRAPIPYNREQFKSLNDQQPEQVDGYMRHIGIYAYRADFIKRYVAWNESPLERIESLEQLRVLWHGEKIHVAEAIMPPAAGIDTPEDLEQARQRIK